MDRFNHEESEQTMWAVVTTGNGDYDKLNYRRVPRPVPEPGHVLLRVLAAGVNNTEINTRLGWYSSSVTGSTDDTADAQSQDAEQKSDGGWNKRTPFPFIQGTDCCGEVVALGTDTEPALMGKRVIVRACMRPEGFGSMENIWMASDFDGAFAEFVTVPAGEVFAVQCDWTNEALAAIPCAYGTAENMLHRAGVGPSDHVLVTGASGGVGSATVQLARRRGAEVTAVAGRSKFEAVRALGAQTVLERSDDPATVLGENAISVVVDNVAGEGFPRLLKALKRGGRYVSSGAIAGPVVALDMRDMYLNDISLIGCTAWDEPVFPNLVSYIERDEIRPVIAAVYPLAQIVEAQKAFMTKQHVGKFVLVPPGAS
ncbi:MAG: alcohol dehydrogenase family protein [Pseudomonadota bacterium]